MTLARLRTLSSHRWLVATILNSTTTITLDSVDEERTHHHSKFFWTGLIQRPRHP